MAGEAGALNINSTRKIQDVVGSAGTQTITPRYQDALNYEYNMISNPGPLAMLDSMPINNFYGGKYNARVLEEDLVIYRAGKSGCLTIPGQERNALGQWFTTVPAESVAKVRIDLAVKSQWIDNAGVLTGTSPIDAVYQVKIPKGTTIYEGPVGSQGGLYSGGMDQHQIFIDQRGGLSDFFIWSNDFDERIKLNEPLDKVREEIWKVLRDI